MSKDDSGVFSFVSFAPSFFYTSMRGFGSRQFSVFPFFSFSLLHLFLFLFPFLLLLLAVVDIWQEISFSLKPHHRFFPLSLFSHTQSNNLTTFICMLYICCYTLTELDRDSISISIDLAIVIQPSLLFFLFYEFISLLYPYMSPL
jgi:hypothetical protein